VVLTLPQLNILLKKAYQLADAKMRDGEKKEATEKDSMVSLEKDIFEELEDPLARKRRQIKESSTAKAVVPEKKLLIKSPTSMWRSDPIMQIYYNAYMHSDHLWALSAETIQDMWSIGGIVHNRLSCFASCCKWRTQHGCLCRSC
jgi:hypothetical protein